MDILHEIGGSRRYNFHSHTQFCDGRAPMEEFVKEAVTRGFTHYGFSPHSPVICGSPCNMAKENVPLYIEEIDRLRSEWGGKIKLYASMEIDYLGDEWGPSNTYFDSIPLDYRIGSVHFIPSESGYVDVDGRAENFKAKVDLIFRKDIRHVVESYYRQSVKMVEAGGFDIIGHFDKIGLNASSYKSDIEQETWYRRLVQDLMDLIISKGLIVEINTKAWSEHKRMFPDVKHFEYLRQNQVPVIVNSDAHFPHLIDASRDVAFELLK